MYFFNKQRGHSETRIRISTRPGVLKLFSWCTTVCDLTHSLYHLQLFYVQSHSVARNISTISLYCCYKENNRHPFRQTGRHSYGVNSSFVRVRVRVVCVCVCVCVSVCVFFYPLIFLTKPMYLWTVAGVPLVVRVPQFEKPWTRLYYSCKCCFFQHQILFPSQILF
jgi:hypothetical protein